MENLTTEEWEPVSVINQNYITLYKLATQENMKQYYELQVWLLFTMKVATKFTSPSEISKVYIKEHCPKMFLLFSRLIVEKIASFLTYLESWWKVVLVFGHSSTGYRNS